MAARIFSTLWHKILTEMLEGLIDNTKCSVLVKNSNYHIVNLGNVVNQKKYLLLRKVIWPILGSFKKTLAKNRANSHLGEISPYMKLQHQNSAYKAF